MQRREAFRFLYSASDNRKAYNSHGTTIIQFECNNPRIPGHGDRLCLQQLHVTNDSFVKTLNSFNYKITLPVLLFKDMSTADFYSVWDTGYVLFCFFVTLFCIIITWVVTGIFYKNRSRLGELVQASYRSSAAVLGIAFIQNIYGNSGMAPLMIVGTVPLYNIAAVLILSFTGPDAKGFDKESLLKSLKGSSRIRSLSVSPWACCPAPAGSIIP